MQHITVLAFTFLNRLPFKSLETNKLETNKKSSIFNYYKVIKFIINLTLNY